MHKKVSPIIWKLDLSCKTLSGYQANFLQLGLDQLLDVPSRHLALFVHLATWVYNVLATIVVVLFTMAVCYITQYEFIMESVVIYSSPIFYSAILIIVLCISYCKTSLVQLWC